MRIKFLGTAAYEGHPSMYCHCPNCDEARRLGGKNLRARTQAIIDDDLLIDFGPDTYMNGMRFNLDYSKIKCILVTHSHGDHFVPAQLRSRGKSYATGLIEPVITVCGNSKIGQKLADGNLISSDAAESTVRFSEIKEYETKKIGDYTVTSMLAHHMPTENALVYIIEKNGKTIFYCLDTGKLLDSDYEFLKKQGKRFDFIAFDCTYGTVEADKYGGHMSLYDDANVFSKLKAIDAADEHTRVAVTHFAHWHTPSHEQMQRLADEFGFTVCYDGIEFEV